MSRLTANDSVAGAMLKMIDGNPGAATVMVGLFKNWSIIDPSNLLSKHPLGICLILDAQEVYGSRIWILYKDVCHESLVDMVAVLRAIQLGIIPRSDVDRAIDAGGDINISTIIEKVSARLPRFNSGTTVEPWT